MKFLRLVFVKLSLTCFQSRMMVEKVLSTNTQSRLASVVLDSVQQPPRLARQSWLCLFSSEVPEATYIRGEVEGP